MINTPLLLFPKFYPDKRIPKQTGFGSPHYHRPDTQQQIDRLTPMFRTMLEAYISPTADGSAPEKTLVFEVAGSVEDFKRAVSKIPGLEWQGEFDDDIPASEEFYPDYITIGPRFFVDKENGIVSKIASEIFTVLKASPLIQKIGAIYYLDISQVEDTIHFLSGKYPVHKEIIRERLIKAAEKVKSESVKGRFFLSVSNQSALQKILQLSEMIKAGKPLGSGYKIWEDILRNSVTIRFWNEEDRLRETKAIEYFKEELELKKETKGTITCEIEFWYNPVYAKQQQIEESAWNIIIAEKGKILNTCIKNEIRFHAVKVALPYESIERILRTDFPGIVRCDDVMFIRPSGQSSGYILEGEVLDEIVKPEIPLPEDRMIAACLDGYPLSNHTLLDGRISIDDPDDYGSSYQAKEMRHGTAMISLICHGDTEAGETTIRSKIYVCPIMQPDKEDFRSETRNEHIPRDVFFEDIVERAVKRIFEGEGDTPAAAPEVKIINLSICDSNKPFLGKMSSVAKLIDWLSFRYNVLFIISAGNINDSYELNINGKNEQEFPDAFFNSAIKNRRQRTLFSPSESINSITVSSLHTDASDNFYHSGSLFNIQPDPALPAPYSSSGLGFRNAIKPDLLLPGGRQLFMKLQDNRYRPSFNVFPPGQKVATPGAEGEINRFIYTRGTSNSCAICTKRAIEIYQMLHELQSEYNYSIPDEYIPVLIKTLLVHGASWGDSDSYFKKILSGNNIHTAVRVKNEIARFLGYGTPHINRILECTQNRVTAIGTNSILKDQRHDYRFPLPPSFSGRKEVRRLIITLAWFSPVYCFSKKYRVASLNFDPKSPAGKIGVSRSEADWQQVKNGTIQHELLEGKEVSQYLDGEYLNIPIVCKEDARPIDTDIRYGLAVTFEIPEEIDVPIYDEIKARIGIEIGIKTT